MDQFAKRLWYARRGRAPDESKAGWDRDWNAAGPHERQSARDEIERVLAGYIAAAYEAPPSEDV